MKQTGNETEEGRSKQTTMADHRRCRYTAAQLRAEWKRAHI